MTRSTQPTYESRTLRPIRTEADYEALLKEADSLWDVEPGTPEGDRLEIILTLLDAYESKAFPIAWPDPVEAIKFRMEQENLVREDLEPYLGSRARVSEILNRKRPLSLEMIRRLHEGLGIPAEVLIQPVQKASK